jgi:hypothetical protein
MVPVQSAMAQVVPIQSAPAQVGIQVQAAPAQLVPMQTQAMQPVTICPPCPPCPPCPSQGAAQQRLDECNRELERLRTLIRQQGESKSSP